MQIPALNEEKTIADVIRRVPRPMNGIDDLAFVVVNDGSTDRTAELAREAGAQVVSHPRPCGVGAAFRTGLATSIELRPDVIVTIDADGQFRPEDVPLLLAPLLAGEADFVTASRFADRALLPEMPRAKRWGNDFMARWISTLTGQRFHDVSCGFRAYSSAAFLRLVLLGTFTYTHETFLSLAFAGLRIREVPVPVRGVREHGKSRVASNLLRYGWQTAGIILRTYRDYRPLRFFSWLAAVLMIFGLGFFAFLMSVKIRTGVFTPHKWSGFVAGAFGAAAMVMYLVGVVAEMLDRIRAAQDEILYRVRRQDYLGRR